MKNLTVHGNIGNDTNIQLPILSIKDIENYSLKSRKEHIAREKKEQDKQSKSAQIEEQIKANDYYMQFMKEYKQLKGVEK